MTGKENDPVDTSIRNWVTDNNFDVFGRSEVNLYWAKVQRNLQFQDQLGQWWQPGQFRGVMAYNRTEKNTQTFYSTIWRYRTNQSNRCTL